MKKTKIRVASLWLPVLLCMLVIFTFSSIPQPHIPCVVSYQDIIYHAFIYALMAYFFSRALKNSSSDFSSLKTICLTVIFGVAYGLSDEFHQMFIPGRIASGFDLFIDGIGSFLGSLLFR